MEEWNGAALDDCQADQKLAVKLHATSEPATKTGFACWVHSVPRTNWHEDDVRRRDAHELKTPHR
jgi:hypothetical protein